MTEEEYLVLEELRSRKGLAKLSQYGVDAPSSIPGRNEVHYAGREENTSHVVVPEIVIKPGEILEPNPTIYNGVDAGEK